MLWVHRGMRSEPSPERWRRWLWVAGGFAFGFGAVFWVVRQAGFDATFAVIARALPFLPCVILLEACRIGTEALAARELFGSLKASVPMGALVRAQLVGYSIGNVLPIGRMSAEASKASILKSHAGLPKTAAVATVAQALHWLDRPAFFAEARRVLAPGGVLAVWCYSMVEIRSEIDRILDAALLAYFAPSGTASPPFAFPRSERRSISSGRPCESSRRFPHLRSGGSSSTELLQVVLSSPYSFIAVGSLVAFRPVRCGGRPRHRSVGGGRSSGQIGAPKEHSRSSPERWGTTPPNGLCGGASCSPRSADLGAPVSLPGPGAPERNGRRPSSSSVCGAARRKERRQGVVDRASRPRALGPNRGQNAPLFAGPAVRELLFDHARQVGEVLALATEIL